MKSLIKKLLGPILSFVRKRHTENLNQALNKLPAKTGITLIDVGAAGDIEPRWKSIECSLNYVGFEPDERSRNLLLQQKHSCLSYKLYPFAVWEKSGSVNLNLCRKPQVSSTYSPNQSFTDLFPDPRRFDVVGVEQMESKMLDEVDVESPDFIKLDIQGGELNALMGGRKLLTNSLGLEIEVELLPLYVKQPLFGEVCEFLSQHGFQFIDFVNLCRWERKASTGLGQCVFGDALFLRTPETLLQNYSTSSHISSYLGICLLYKRFDLIYTTYAYSVITDHSNRTFLTSDSGIG